MAVSRHLVGRVADLARLQGDFVECGVNRGGFSRAVVDYVDFGRLAKTFYLMDTFDGLVEAHITPEERAHGRSREAFAHYSDCFDDVRDAFRPFANVVLVRGPIPDTLAQVTPEKVKRSVDRHERRPAGDRGGRALLGTTRQRRGHDPGRLRPSAVRGAEARVRRLRGGPWRPGPAVADRPGTDLQALSAWTIRGPVDAARDVRHRDQQNWHVGIIHWPVTASSLRPDRRGCNLDRRGWLLERRAAVEATYDAEAPTYDETPTQPRRNDGLSGGSWPRARLTASCWTPRVGRVSTFSLVAAAGRRVVGIDQSLGMLEQARVRGIAVALHQVGLQELPFQAEFDAVMTIDAMENVFPEHWPLVLANLHRAVRSGGHLYLTVEEVAESVVDGAFATLVARGLPVVRGEVIEGDVAGYHYYPGRDRVRRWLEAEGLAVVKQDTEAHEGWAYWHLLLRSRADAQAEQPSRQPTSR